MSYRNVVAMIVLFLFFACAAQALRVTRPPLMKFPLEEDQISQLNRFNEEMWNMQYGRFEFEVTDTPKTNAKDGEMWFLETGVITRIQIKANDTIFTFTPDGY